MNASWRPMACLWGALATWAVVQIPGSAAGPSTPLAQLTVDVVSMREGGSLRGSVVEQRSDGNWLMVVSAKWLEAHDPTRYTSVLSDNTETQRAAETATLKRVLARLQEPLDSPRLKFFLERERDRLTRVLEDPPPLPEFLWIELQRHEIARLVRPTPERQRLGFFAWYAHLDGVESKSALALQKELVALDFPLAGPAPDLGDRLPPREQTDREWAARLAIVEYSLADPLEFQGSGTTVVRTGTGAAVDWKTLLPALLEQHTQRLLDELTGINVGDQLAAGTPWMASATEQARRLNSRGFRVTTVDALGEAGQVTVESRLVVNLDDQRWITVWLNSQSADGTVPRPELEERITSDPQVQSLLQSLRALQAGGNDMITQAIRHGAATMDAQAEVDAEFFRFRDRYLQKLDCPCLLLSTP